MILQLNSRMLLLIKYICLIKKIKVQIFDYKFSKIFILQTIEITEKISILKQRLFKNIYTRIIKFT